MDNKSKHHLSHLQKHYSDMNKKNEFASVFNCKYNGKGFRCLFIADDTDKTLFISSIGKNSFVIPIRNISDNFEITSLYLGDKYRPLANYLELRYDPVHHFVPIDFLIQLDETFPTCVTEVPSVRERSRLIRKANGNNDKKDYFTGWAKWTKKNTTLENEEKTASIIGPSDAARCRAANISSCWSSDPEQENLSKLDLWIKLNQ